ncbi:hypothetical protein J2I47_22980 [Fibrella sp. HMF5335]|uniref:site-specific DNA-methyltransferase (cytosine-N(4)-specific) n=1 Tax=Fibrella rubiginis TaxID=2817060 RepID=A0A939GHT8_9BACT|nr:hypothetical protein [Fibrella rubiginis]MBO0939432.1 hypothetical protein [Fibrella rubiginis]
MAPEIAFQHLERIPKNSLVLDPMVGSGTTMKVAGSLGCRGIGFDVDPMALLIATVWNRKVDLTEVIKTGYKVLDCAVQVDIPGLPWIDTDTETLAFIKFWFAEEQEMQLRKLSYLLAQYENEIGDVLRVALSRIIITKNRGASLGRDISHSRPHKVNNVNDFNVFAGFERSFQQVCKILKTCPGNNLSDIRLGDAKDIEHLRDETVDYILTSPPYLTAVDYFRGHRISLVWLGYTLKELRGLRSASVGLDKKPDSTPDNKLLYQLLKGVGETEQFTPSIQKALPRYALDLYDISKEYFRVLKPGQKATVVLADSYSNGKLVSSTQLFENAAMMNGFKLLQTIERPILASKRYLPPPMSTANNSLDKRMKTEAIMTFLKP